MKVKRVISKRRFEKYGYEHRTELVSEIKGPVFRTKSCYTLEGDYIGGPKLTNFLCRENKLTKLQKRRPESCCVSIGFSEEKQKWFGWSHRAFFGFGVGDKAFRRRKVLQTLQECKSSAKQFARSVS